MGGTWSKTSGICTDGFIAGRTERSPLAGFTSPKPDGRTRPLGIPALEDKILQRATVEVLNQIYEEDFLGFS